MNPCRNLIIKTIAVIIIIAAMVFYYFVNPEDADFVPKCVLKHLTGFDCPSCGAQRAFHSVLHGEFIKALSYNPFFIISVPYFLLVLYATVFKGTFAKKVNRITFHRYTLYAYVVLFFVWWIVRNI